MHALFKATIVLYYLTTLTTTFARPLNPVFRRRAVAGPHHYVFAGNASSPLPLNSTSNQCLSSGNSTTIQSLLTGNGSLAVLCPNSTFQLYEPINFTAPNQVITTLGSPTDSSRAMLIISANITAAIFGNCDDCSGDVISHIQINGNRAGLGRISSGSSALIEIGANTADQRVEFVRAFDPRGWSCMHIAEGPNMSCRNATIANNDIGPCGVAAEDDFPFASVNGTGRSLIDGFPGTISSNLTSGHWADGISHACPYSLVSNNTVTDASDGGIVIFGAFGSQVVNNHIRSLNQTLLGAINMVDATPSNNYTDILVFNNTIEARDNGYIKVGIGCGPAVWGDDLTSRNFGGTVTGNTFTGPNLGFGVVVSGVYNWTVQDNEAALDAVFSAGITQSCHGLQIDPSLVALDLDTVDNSTVQPGSFGPVQFVICTESAAFLQDEAEADDPDAVPDDGNDCPTPFYANCSAPSGANPTLSSSPAAALFTDPAATITVGLGNVSIGAASVTGRPSTSATSTLTVSITATATAQSSTSADASVVPSMASVNSSIGTSSSFSLSAATSTTSATSAPSATSTATSQSSASVNASIVSSAASLDGSVEAGSSSSFSSSLATPATSTTSTISASVSLSIATPQSDTGAWFIPFTPSPSGDNEASSSSSVSTDSMAPTSSLPSTTSSSATPSASVDPLSGLDAGLPDYVLVANSTGLTGGKKPCPHPSHHKSVMRRWVESLAW